MEDREKRYTGNGVVVRYNPKRCIHFAACVRGLPDVFDPKARPWIAPEHADADSIAAVVRRCPTGALHYERNDGGAAEQPQAHGSVQVTADGPLHVRGEIMVQREDGTPIVSDTRVALCRCGMSGNKPFCDGAHKQGFHDSGQLAAQSSSPEPEAGPLMVTVSARGPYRLSGPVTLCGADGSETHMHGTVVLCRCGASKHKPFCDGSHRQVDQEIFT
jgi:CDGSH-type Zn-finger protein/uncharacterized Fe-S cluster protein YjdI